MSKLGFLGLFGEGEFFVTIILVYHYFGLNRIKMLTDTFPKYVCSRMHCRMDVLIEYCSSASGAGGGAPSADPAVLLDYPTAKSGCKVIYCPSPNSNQWSPSSIQSQDIYPHSLRPVFALPPALLPSACEHTCQPPRCGGSAGAQKVP